MMVKDGDRPDRIRPTTSHGCFASIAVSRNVHSSYLFVAVLPCMAGHAIEL